MRGSGVARLDCEPDAVEQDAHHEPGEADDDEPSHDLARAHFAPGFFQPQIAAPVLSRATIWRPVLSLSWSAWLRMIGPTEHGKVPVIRGERAAAEQQRQKDHGFAVHACSSLTRA